MQSQAGSFYFPITLNCVQIACISVIITIHFSPPDKHQHCEILWREKYAHDLVFINFLFMYYIIGASWHFHYGEIFLRHFITYLICTNTYFQRMMAVSGEDINQYHFRSYTQSINTIILNVLLSEHTCMLSVYTLTVILLI